MIYTEHKQVWVGVGKEGGLEMVVRVCVMVLFGIIVC